jgi:hypothetical protein
MGDRSGLAIFTFEPTQLAGAAMTQITANLYDRAGKNAMQAGVVPMMTAAVTL